MLPGRYHPSRSVAVFATTHKHLDRLSLNSIMSRAEYARFASTLNRATLSECVLDDANSLLVSADVFPNLDLKRWNPRRSSHQVQSQSAQMLLKTQSKLGYGDHFGSTVQAFERFDLIAVAATGLRSFVVDLFKGCFDVELESSRRQMRCEKTSPPHAPALDPGDMLLANATDHRLVILTRYGSNDSMSQFSA